MDRKQNSKVSSSRDHAWLPLPMHPYHCSLRFADVDVIVHHHIACNADRSAMHGWQWQNAGDGTQGLGAAARATDR